MADRHQPPTPLPTEQLLRAEDARRAAINLLEDAVQARRTAEELNRRLREEMAERQRAEMLLQCQKEALEMMAGERPLEDVLEFLARAIESQAPPGVMSAIHVLNAQGTHFAATVAPSLPAEYRDATQGLAIESRFGPCCDAVLSGTPIVVRDMTQDPRWPRFAEFAMSCGIHAGWSTPIVSSGRTILGTFAVYYDGPREPSPQDQQRLEIITRTVALTIERKTADEALRESERRFREMVDVLPAAIFTTDAEGRLTHFNPASIDLSGRVPQLAADRWCVSWKLYRPDGTPLPHEESPMATALKEGRVVRGEEIIVERPDGSRLWCAAYPTPLRDATGTIVGGVKMLVDITERKEYEKRLSDSDRRKNEFLAMLAHELRNPLAPILGSIEILRRAKGLERHDEGAVQGRRVEHALDVLQRQVGQMVRLVDDLLDAGRISRGRIDLRRERVELSSCVYHVLDAVHLISESRDQELTVSLSPAPMYVNADPIRLAQILGNLLSNASKFTDRGGHIWLTVEREAPGDDHGDGELRRLAPQVVIRVRDNGIGVAADQIEHLFDMFTQGDTSLERSVSGLGIGLTLVKTLTEMHGGTVAASSAGPGQGSEFVVRLPIEAGIDLPVSPPTKPQAAMTPLRILIVDDNHDSADMLAMLLKFSGHETVTAHDGLAAVEAAAASHPDVVLLDIGLPRLNGYEAARRIRAARGSEGCPLLIALTGWGQDEDRRRSEEAGFDAHLVKPIDAAVLNGLLAKLGARNQEV